jgi:hypothetical protein
MTSEDTEKPVPSAKEGHLAPESGLSESAFQRADTAADRKAAATPLRPGFGSPWGSTRSPACSDKARWAWSSRHMTR